MTIAVNVSGHGPDRAAAPPRGGSTRCVSLRWLRLSYFCYPFGRRPFSLPLLPRQSPQAPSGPPPLLFLHAANGKTLRTVVAVLGVHVGTVEVQERPAHARRVRRTAPGTTAFTFPTVGSPIRPFTKNPKRDYKSLFCFSILASHEGYFFSTFSPHEPYQE